MRFEATLSDVRGRALIQMAEELGMSRSQFIDEALALWLEVIEARRQLRRLAALSENPAEAPEALRRLMVDGELNEAIAWEAGSFLFAQE